MSESFEPQAAEIISPASSKFSRSGFRAALWESIKGSNRDFTEGSLGRAIVLLAVPMVLEMIMESLFGVVNIFFVSRLGAEEVATVGLTESMLTIVFAVGLGLSMATTATVARRIGEKKREEAAIAAVQGIALGILVSLPVALVGIFFSTPLLRWMGASPEVLARGTGYSKWILGGNATVLLLFLINAVFRGAGDAVIAMRVLWLANLVNIILDPCLIFGLGPFPRLGVTGAAIATNIGRGLGVCFQIYSLMNGRGRIAVRKEHLRIFPKIMGRLLRISVGGFFQYLVATASWVGLVRIVALFGSFALAGYTIALRIVVFAILPSWGLANAAAALVGQNLGARKPDRAEKAVWLAGLANMVFLGAVAVTFILFANPLVRLFTQDPSVVPLAVDCLRYVSYGYVFYAYGMVMVQAFNGAGDTVTPTIINLCCYWMFQIPLAYTLATKTSLGARGVFLAITIAESTIAIVGVLAFRRGYWKTRVV